MVEILTGEVTGLIDDNISWYLESWSLSITLSRRKASKFALAIWPVSGQGFQNTKWPAVLYSQYISQNRKIPANLSYHMSIKCFENLNRQLSWKK